MKLGRGSRIIYAPYFLDKGVEAIIILCNQCIGTNYEFARCIMTRPDGKAKHQVSVSSLYTIKDYVAMQLAKGMKDAKTNSADST